MKTLLIKVVAAVFMVAVCGALYETCGGQWCIVRVGQPSEQQFLECLNEGQDIAAYIPGSHLDLVTEVSDIPELEKRFGTVSVIESDDAVNKRRVLRKGMSIPAGYQTYDEMLKKLKDFEQQHPDICKLYDLGDSHGKTYTGSDYDAFKHDIWALKVSDNVQNSEAEPKFYFMGEHHAREAASMEVCMAVLEHIIENYRTDPAVTGRVNECELWFIPLVNPDGHKIALTMPSHNMWRKNIRDNNDDGKISYETQITANDGNTDDGVDLNRNYSYQWGTTGTTTGNPSFITYCGPSGFSEPEIACLKPLLDEQRFTAGISFHLYSELVLWSYGYRQWKHAPDSAAMGNLGRKLAEKLPKKNGSGTYKPQKMSDLYAASGSLDDYVYSQHGTFAYTIEMYDSTFWPPESEVQKLKQNNKVAAMELLNRSTYACITGIIQDKSKGAAVEAEIYVKEIDDTAVTKTSWRAPVLNNTTTGFYMRLLNPGTYTVTFKPENPAFRDTTFKDVVIYADKVTKLDIDFKGNGTGILTSGNTVAGGISLVKRSSDRLLISLPSGHQFVNAKLFTLDGKFVHHLLPRPGNLSFELVNGRLGKGLYLLRLEGTVSNKEIACMLD